MFESIKLSDLTRNNYELLREATKSRPPIWSVEEDGKRAVIKDFSTKSFLFRNIVGRLLVWRESKAYRALNGIKGVPAFYGSIDGVALILEEVPGQSLKDFEEEMAEMISKGAEPSEIEEKRALLSEEFFDSLEKLLHSIHERRIVHCDLKRTPNIMIGNDGLPYIVDWASFMSKREFSFFPLNLLYRKFLQDDHLAVIKLKVNNRPDLATPAEHKAYSEYKMRREKRGVEKTIRDIRSRLRNLLKKMA